MDTEFTEIWEKRPDRFPKPVRSDVVILPLLKEKLPAGGRELVKVWAIGDDISYLYSLPIFKIALVT